MVLFLSPNVLALSSGCRCDWLTSQCAGTNPAFRVCLGSGMKDHEFGGKKEKNNLIQVRRMKSLEVERTHYVIMR